MGGLGGTYAGRSDHEPSPQPRVKPHTILSAVAAVGLATGAALPARADTITEQEAHAIGVDAYVYFYPLITMDITRRQLTNASAGSRLRPRPNEHDLQRAGVSGGR